MRLLPCRTGIFRSAHLGVVVMRDCKFNFKFQAKRLSRKLWRRLKRESPALFVFLSLLAGAVLFGLITNEVSGITSSVWPLIAVSVAIMNLPKTFGKNRANDLYTIRFARAFRDGFVPMCSMMQGVQGSWRK
jgi:hypothetical protein